MRRTDETFQMSKKDLKDFRCHFRYAIIKEWMREPTFLKQDESTKTIIVAQCGDCTVQIDVAFNVHDARFLCFSFYKTAHEGVFLLLLFLYLATLHQCFSRQKKVQPSHSNQMLALNKSQHATIPQYCV